MRLFSSVILVGLLVTAALVWGGCVVWQQHHKLRHYAMTTGEVVAVKADPAWRGRSRYEPLIEYRYRAEGGDFAGRGVTPLASTGNERWARGLIAEFSPGMPVRIYYDPADPSQSYLIRHLAFWPYAVALFPAGVLGLCYRPLVRGGVTFHAPVVTQAAKGAWYRLTPNRNAGETAQWAALAALTWLLYGTALLGHYYFLAATTGQRFAVIPALVALGYGAMALVPVAGVVRTIKQSHRLAPATVCIMLPQLKVDQPIVVRVEQLVRRDVAIEFAAVALACYRRTGLSSADRFFRSQKLVQQRQLRAGEMIVGEHTFTIPPKKQRESSKWSRWEYPRTDWQIELTVALQQGPTYRACYPIHLTRA